MTLPRRQMSPEKEKMLQGQLYDPGDSLLIAERQQARALCRELNLSPQQDMDAHQRILAKLFGGVGEGVWIEPPFYCDYGENITLGDKVFSNFNCVILDPAPVTIGSRVQFGPSVQVYTATHPLDAAERSAGIELAEPVEIGDDVWIGGGAILLPSVQIGSRSVIGAGSVVTRPIPADVFAAGNPCRVVRPL